MTPAIIDREAIHPLFPTHLHTADFWEQLGRTIATFGFLEDTLAKAIFAFTATTKYSEVEAQKVLEKWPSVLENAMIETLHRLAKIYGQVVRDHHDADVKNVSDLVDNIKQAADIRNALCHGLWQAPEPSGKSPLSYFNNKMEKFDTPIDVAWLKKVQNHVVTISCDVIDSVAVMGWQFPGGTGPGSPIWAEVGE
ncbi:hypothetical protein [Acidovorax soli]|uniref:hypothetical protein n=1 Tax=Acidovorax TaxID=12916 RepID=UPI0026ED38B4|nr:hypothetical protein [Acidovorax soli]MCM2347911.1 hypothetical protein [Acidovorax soli]